MRTVYKALSFEYIFRLDYYGNTRKFFIHRMSFHKFVPNFIWRWQKRIFDFEFVPTVHFLHKFQIDRFYMKTLLFLYWSSNNTRSTSIFSMYLLEMVLAANKWFS
jgi:hypothetical protein